MNPETKQLEAELAQLYEEQLSSYEQALAIVQTLPSAFGNTSAVDEPLSRLASSLEHVREVDEKTSSIKRELKARGRQPGAPMGPLLKRIEVTLKQLIEGVDESEGCARKAKENLSPELQQGDQRRRTLAAYKSAAEY